MNITKIFHLFLVLLCFPFMVTKIIAQSEIFEYDGSVLLQQQMPDKVTIKKENQQMLTASAKWSQFTQKHGNWAVQWNEATRTPHRAFGPAIKINGFNQINKVNVEKAAKSFLRENQSILKVDVDKLKLAKAVQLNEKWYVSYKQIHNGVEVLLSEVELRIFRNGKVMNFGVDYYADIKTSSIPGLSFYAA